MLWTMLGLEILAHLFFFFQNASFGPSPNLHICISLVEVYRFEQCLGGYFCPDQFTFLLSVLVRLAMRHTLTFGVGILKYAHWAF